MLSPEERERRFREFMTVVKEVADQASLGELPERKVDPGQRAIEDAMMSPIQEEETGLFVADRDGVQGFLWTRFDEGEIFDSTDFTTAEMAAIARVLNRPVWAHVTVHTFDHADEFFCMRHSWLCWAPVVDFIEDGAPAAGLDDLEPATLLKLLEVWDVEKNCPAYREAYEVLRTYVLGRSGAVTVAFEAEA